MDYHTSTSKTSVGMRTTALLAILVAVMVGIVSSDVAGATHVPPTLVGSHPHARQQPTAAGRRIEVVSGFAGRVYFGYGDTVGNTGPIVISSYEPNRRAWTDHLTFRTEKVGRFRTIGRALWAPAWDATGREDVAYAATNSRHAWGAAGVGLRPVHVYDASARVPAERYISGAFEGIGGAVAAWTGKGWGISLSVPGQYSRFYHLGALHEKLYTVLGNVSGTAPDHDVGQASYVFDGTTWSRGPRLDGFIKPMLFAGTLVYRSEDGRLLSFDGTTIRTLSAPGAVDHDVAGGKLVVFFGVSRKLYSTSDMVSWTTVGTVPSSATAVGLLDGFAYLGTADAEVYKMPLH
ncbi:MAG TPA: hypothetical protein VGV93_14320 [Acidimicrobiales bacterium]|nr:hypothetical protein [Acidimicrobiales bacterium]